MFVAFFRTIIVPQKISPELRALFIHRTLVRFALGVTSAFTVIFLYELFSSVYAALAAFAALYIATAVLTPLGSMAIRRLGLRRQLVLATPLLAFSAAALSFTTGATPHLTPVAGVVAYVLFATIYKVFYWVPYDVDMAEAMENNYGRKIALLDNMADLLLTATPLLGGLIVALYGYEHMFTLGVAVVLCAIVPLLWLKPREESFDWTYRETWARLFDRRYRALVLGYMGDGLQSAILAVVWPLLVFTLFGRSYETVGAVASITLVVLFFVRFVTGALFDGWSRERTLFWGAMLSASGWVAKLFVATPVHVVLADTYHGAGQAVNRTGIEAMTYAQAADNGRYIDEFTTLKEMALNIGRFCALVFVAAATALSGVSAGFAAGILLAAVSSILTVFLAERVAIDGLRA
jgi:MFS family permease